MHVSEDRLCVCVKPSPHRVSVCVFVCDLYIRGTRPGLGVSVCLFDSSPFLFFALISTPPQAQTFIQCWHYLSVSQHVTHPLCPFREGERLEGGLWVQMYPLQQCVHTTTLLADMCVHTTGLWLFSLSLSRTEQPSWTCKETFFWKNNRGAPTGINIYSSIANQTRQKGLLG